MPTEFSLILWSIRQTLVSAVMNLRVLWKVGNFLTSCKPFSCSGRTLHHGVGKYTITFNCHSSISWNLYSPV